MNLEISFVDITYISNLGSDLRLAWSILRPFVFRFLSSLWFIEANSSSRLAT
jgi:hypothetical protein